MSIFSKQQQLVTNDIWVCFLVSFQMRKYKWGFTMHYNALHCNVCRCALIGFHSPIGAIPLIGQILDHSRFLLPFVCVCLFALELTILAFCSLVCVCLFALEGCEVDDESESPWWQFSLNIMVSHIASHYIMAP